jgi:hypothetical protein
MQKILSRRIAVVCVIVGLTLLASSAAAQVEVKSKAMELTITGRVHGQFNTSSVAGEPGSEFLVRRARLTAELKINDFVSGKIQPDFGEGEINLKDAYVRLTFSPSFRATIGQFKRPFDLFELTSSTQILVIERAGGVRGVSACPGPGGVCSFSRLTEKLQYSDRDIGVMIDGKDPSGRFTYAASVTNGVGANTADENGPKSYTGRVGFSPVENVTIAAHAALHDYVDPSTDDEYATAFGGDVEVGEYSQGLHVKAGIAAGENWLNLVAGEPSNFLSAQAIVTYKLAVPDNPFVSHVEPLTRASWGDPDTDASDDEGWLFTPGFVVHFVGRNKIAANVDVWNPAVGDTECSIKVQSYLHF